MNAAYLLSERELVQAVCSVSDVYTLVDDVVKQTGIHETVKRIRILNKALNLQVASRLPVLLILDRVSGYASSRPAHSRPGKWLRVFSSCSS